MINKIALLVSSVVTLVLCIVAAFVVLLWYPAKSQPEVALASQLRANMPLVLEAESQPDLNQKTELPRVSEQPTELASTAEANKHAILVSLLNDFGVTVDQCDTIAKGGHEAWINASGDLRTGFCAIYAHSKFPGCSRYKLSIITFSLIIPMDAYHKNEASSQLELNNIALLDIHVGTVGADKINAAADAEERKYLEKRRK